MRKPRDFDAELKALDAKARQLKERKLAQLGELVLATGADALPVELLAGALLSAAGNNDLVTKEEWRKRGEAFFQRASRQPARSVDRAAGNNKASGGSAKPAAEGASSS